MEEPGRLQSMGSRRVRHDWATSLSLFTFMHWRRKWQPTPAFLPGESRDGGAWWAAIYGVAQSWTRLKRLSSSSSSIYLQKACSWMFAQFLFLWVSFFSCWHRVNIQWTGWQKILFSITPVLTTWNILSFFVTFLGHFSTYFLCWFV